MPTKRFLTPKTGALQLLKQAPALKFSGRSVAEWQSWRRKLATALKKLMGPTPPPAPMNFQRIKRVQENGYIREKVRFNPDAFSTISAYVLVPNGLSRGQRRPAVLCAHGHGSGKFGLIDPRDSNYHRIAEKLCRDERFVVIAPDWRSFGERSDERAYIQHWPGEHGADGCDLSYMLYGYFGYQLLALNVNDARRCIDYIATRPEVDAKRIGMIGLSFGGTMTTFASALDRRVKAAVISGYLSTIADALGDRGRGNTCGSQFLFGLRAIGEIADVAGLIAPRPCLVQIGRKDPCFIERDALSAYRDVQKIYRAAGAAKNLELDLFNGGHEFNVAPALEFLRRRLANGG